MTAHLQYRSNAHLQNMRVDLGLSAVSDAALISQYAVSSLRRQCGVIDPSNEARTRAPPTSAVIA